MSKLEHECLTDKLNQYPNYSDIRNNSIKNMVLSVHDSLSAMIMALNNSVNFITDDEIQYNQFIRDVINNKEFSYNYNAVLIDSSKWEDIDKIIVEYFGNMKYDVIIGNPPYDGDLHLRITNKLFDFLRDDTSEMLIISPDDYSISLFKYMHWNENDNKVNIALSHMIDYQHLNAEQANEIFSTGNILNCLSISRYKKNVVNKYSINYFYDKQIIDLYSKIINTRKQNKKNVQSFAACYRNSPIGFKRNSHKFNVTTDVLVANRTCVNERKDRNWNPSYYVISFDDKTSRVKNGISFKTPTEKTNFLNSLNSKIYKFLHEVCGETDAYTLKMLKDYTKPVTDNVLMTNFGITSKDYDFICSLV